MICIWGFPQSYYLVKLGADNFPLVSKKGEGIPRSPLEEEIFYNGIRPGYIKQLPQSVLALSLSNR